MAKIIIRNRISEHLEKKAERQGKRRITQEEIFESTGLSSQTISTHINNKVKRYDVRVIEKWCDFLDIHPSQFFKWSDDNGDDDDTEQKPPLLLAI